MENKIPDLRLFIHYPASGFNIGAIERSMGSKAVVIQRKRLKAMGVLPGVPDFFWPVARGRYPGLWIELKREKGGKTTEEQNAWITAMQSQGYCAVVAHGYDEAIGHIINYNSQQEAV